MQKVKKLTALLLAALSCGTMLTGCGNSPEAGQEPSLAVYSFSGENAYFSISNGIAVTTPEKDIFYGGDLEAALGSEDITGYFVTFYTVSGGEETVLLSNGVHDHTGGTLDPSGPVGRVSGDVFSASVAAAGLSGGLYCELETTDRDGAENTYLLELTVTEIEGPSDE